VLAAVPISGKSLAAHTFLFMGAGEAGTGIAELIAQAIAHETGKTIEQARGQIWLVDSKGLVAQSRSASLQHHKLLFAHDAPECRTLEEAIDRIKPSALIGVCTIAKAFSKKVCETMATLNDRPIIFALSNPTSKAECTAEEAYRFTDGRCIFASGSPFDPVEYQGKVFVPGQGNNSYIFPGIGLACVGARLTRVDNEIMIIAAETLAKLVTPKDLETGCVYPPLSSIRSVSLEIATAIAEYAYTNGFATTARPANIKEYLCSIMYNP
jgi:malate dehydrogenase (oxaloacetate-decarboxylating)(NADP+)